IVLALGERYGQHPAVAGWQIDNEFGCHDTTRCYCDACALAFRHWLQARYGSINALNDAWGTVFWSQSYSDWSEIKPPNQTVTEANPSHVLDYERFSSDAVIAYQQLQIDLLRETAPGKRITTNMMGEFADIDYHKLSHPLDFASWDSYPTGKAEMGAGEMYLLDEPRPAFAYDTGDPYATGFCHDLTRGFKQAPFWVMEQQCGNINWGRYNPGVRPGTTRLWTWHAVASGAEAVVYFRWRATLFAQEQMHSGLLMHDASPATGYYDVQGMQAEKDLLDAVSEQPFHAEAAILVDYEDLWALQLQPHRAGFTYWRELFTFYRAFQHMGVGVDLAPFDADLSRYRLIVAPVAFIMSAERSEKLRSAVENGATLLLGVRAGFKTPSNKVVDQPLPGLLRDLAGVTVTDWHALPPCVEFPVESNYTSLEVSAGVWAEALRPLSSTDTCVLASYATGPFEGKAAFTQKNRCRIQTCRCTPGYGCPRNARSRGIGSRWDRKREDFRRLVSPPAPARGGGRDAEKPAPIRRSRRCSDGADGHSSSYASFSKTARLRGWTVFSCP
ncbi:MAG TPA: beta-galactosidase, partial [Anaerolineaceae bacterium]|nr:beta-galactosidase [Anaerolineaceae bacterium]